MVDLHLHILPGLDDGAEDLETAVRMAKMAAHCQGSSAGNQLRLCGFA